MEPFLIITILLLIVVILLGIALFTSTQKKAKPDDMMIKLLESMQGNVDTRLKDLQGSLRDQLTHVQQQMFQTTDQLNKRVSDSSQAMNERLDNATSVIGNVQRELGTINEIGRKMSDLQALLISPKTRGNIGEQIMKDLLEQMLPASNFDLQYTFNSGEKVDAVVRIEEGLIPIDAKFPLTNFNPMINAQTQEEREQYRKDFERDMKKHIDDISRKYILPGEGTVDFALLYLPSEAMYYEVVVNSPNLGEYAWQKRVLPVSPNVFYAYLKAILIGLQGKKIEAQAKEILKAIKMFQRQSQDMGEAIRLSAKHMTNAKNALDEAITKHERLENTGINQVNNLQLLPPESP